jgi:hypothetical protein
MAPLALARLRPPLAHAGRPVVALLAFALPSLSLPAVARADVTTPFGPGVTVNQHTGAGTMVVVSLCTAGVSVRATRFGERKKTPQQWAEAVGTQVAINADFFDFPNCAWVGGRAKGAGEDWPADAQQHYAAENRPYFQFGKYLADVVGENATAPSPDATDIVGGHDVVIAGGQKIGLPGDAYYTSKRPRTGIGLSGDRRTLFLFSTASGIGVDQLADAMAAHASEAGAPSIDYATNVDGGGSSQMYVQGRGQVVTSGRLVANHLGIHVGGGSGEAVNCNDHPPAGQLDVASCESIGGWAQDPDALTSTIPVHLYFNAAAGQPGAVGLPTNADQERADLCGPLGSCNHAFAVPPPWSLFDGKPHEVHAYGIGADGGQNAELGGSPKTLTCAAPAIDIDGELRHIPNPTVLAAWAFDTFRDLAPVSDEALAKAPEGAVLPNAPSLVRLASETKVWLVDGGVRRHVPNPAAAAAWHLDLGKVQSVEADVVNQLVEASPLPARPLLVKGSGDAIYVVLAAPPTAPAGGGGSGGAASAGGGGAGAGAGGALGPGGGASAAGAPEAAGAAGRSEAATGTETATHVPAAVDEGGCTTRSLDRTPARRNAALAAGTLAAIAALATRRRARKGPFHSRKTDK